ncbi:MAG: hypothetical protein GXO00_01565 [Candidatus Diapherotrites archaeon]|nr:hypothetical protein [Candidatus Diapherotrites archaeon]
MTEALLKLLEEINVRLIRIEHALIPPVKLSPAEVAELEELFKDAISGNTRNWRDVDKELER